MTALSWEKFLKQASQHTGAEHLDPDQPIAFDRSAWEAWWQSELDRPLVMIEGYQPPESDTPPTSGSRPIKVPTLPENWTVDQTLDYFELWLGAKRYYGDAFPKWFPDLGSNGVAIFRGTKIQTTPGGEVWFLPDDAQSIADIHVVYEENNYWWRRVRELTSAAIDRWQRRVVVGHVVLGGNLDILGAIRTTQQLALDMVDSPEEVSRLSADIRRLWLRYYHELAQIIETNRLGTTNWAAIWSPLRTYMLQSDFSYMISPRMFRQFVLPDLEECCCSLDHPFYHMDGKGQINHLDMLLSISNLKGIQWIPGAGQPPPEEWLPLLKKIRDGGKLCQLYVTPQGARKIVRELGGKGFALFIEQPMGKDEAVEFLQVLATEDHLGCN